MQSLNLDSHARIKLPASEFPDKADVYVCDKCGRDITERLQRGAGHTAWQIGTERYRCQCGEK